MPAANLARLLRDYGFLNIALKFLVSLHEFTHETGTRILNQAGHSVSSMSGGSSGATDPSSATVGASVESSHATIKGMLDGASFELNHSGSKSQPNLGLLFGTVCAIVWQLQQLANDDSHGYAVEHLKMALRASPEQASEMLGTSLRITDYMFAGVGGDVVDGDVFEPFICPWVTIWNWRSKKIRQDNVDVC